MNLFKDDSFSQDTFNSIQTKFTGVDLNSLVVCVEEDVDMENLKKIQTKAVNVFETLGLSIRPYEAATTTEKKVEEKKEEKTAPVVAEAKKEEEDSDSDSDSSDSEDEKEEKKKPAAVPVVAKKEAEEDSDDDSDSDSDSSSSEEEKKKETPKKKEVVAEEETTPSRGKKKKPNTPFRRVKSSGKSFASNAWEAGKHGDHGSEAHEKLGKFRGADFIKAKNKRKRSNRSGYGSISMDVHSVDLSKRRKLS